MGLDSALTQALEIEKISVPTDIQSSAIPIILQKKDTIIQSETGTGKTLAYLLPLFERFKSASKEMNALILAPTHELVIQIQRQMERLSKNSGLNFFTLPMIGNTNILRQIEKLKEKPRIIVGSSGRLLELIQKRKINSQTIQTIVLDEADQLMDKNNNPSVLARIKSGRKDCQMIMVSASILQTTLDSAQKIMKDPVILRSEERESIPASISHIFLEVDQRDKIELLRKIINNIKPDKTLIFINKPDMIEELRGKLEFHGIKTESIHGTGTKNNRKQAMEDYQSGKIKVLIASDLAARGLHMEGITHIFNMDIPEEPKIYLHRAGRTGRMGLPGLVVSIVSDYELAFLKKIEHKLKICIEERIFSTGNLLTTEGSPIK